jgi:cation-transporting ATPase F
VALTPIRDPWIIGGVAGMVVLQLYFTYLPFVNPVPSSAPVDGLAWARIVAFSVLVYGVVEMEKWLRRRAYAGRT